MLRNSPIGICLELVRGLSWIITTLVTLVVVCVLWNGELRRAKLSLLSVNSHILRFTLEIPISTIPATVQWTINYNSVKKVLSLKKFLVYQQSYKKFLMLIVSVIRIYLMRVDWNTNQMAFHHYIVDVFTYGISFYVH